MALSSNLSPNQNHMLCLMQKCQRQLEGRNKVDLKKLPLYKDKKLMGKKKSCNLSKLKHIFYIIFHVLAVTNSDGQNSSYFEAFK